MKIKFKLKPVEYSELVKVVGLLPYKQMAISNANFINLKYFYYEGLRHVQKQNLNNGTRHSTKRKVYHINFNHYEALKNVLTDYGYFVNQYIISIFLSIKFEAEPQINNEVTQIKFINAITSPYERK